MRLFVALDLPWDVREPLSALAGGLPGARWVAPENYHLTLRFIGETQPLMAEEIDLALATLRGRGFTLQLAGLGTFQKSGRATTLWAGVERNPQLDHLQGKIETALKRCGLDSERRRFNPHITLGHIDTVPEAKVAAYIQARNLAPLPSLRVEHFTLFSSHLGKEQPVYTPEVEYDLAAA